MAAGQTASSPKPLQSTLATHDVLVVPLNVPGLGQPALQVCRVYLIDGGVTDFGRFKAPFLCQSFLFKRPTAPIEY